MNWLNILNNKSIKILLFLASVVIIIKINNYLTENKSAAANNIEVALSKAKSKALTLNYKPPVEDAPQKGRKPSAGRSSNCPESEKDLTALVPKWNLALTVAETPTLWFYVPYDSNVIKSARLVLWDEDQNKVAEVDYSINKAPGIIKFNVPEKLLVRDKRYKLDFAINCYKQDNIRTSPIFPIVTTWMKRVDLKDDLASQLKAITEPREKYALYAANGIWYEALTELIQAKENQNDDEQVTKDWQDFLNQPEIDLPELISEPIISCCDSQ